MEEIGIRELTSEQLEKLCEIGEKAAKEYVLSKLDARKISDLNITVTSEGTRPVTINVDVEIRLSTLMQGYDAEKLVKEATETAFEAIKEYLSELSCKSAKY